MVLEATVDKDIQVEDKKESSSPTARGRVRRKKKTAPVKPSDVPAEDKAGTGQKAVPVTQLDVGEVTRVVASSETPAQISAPKRRIKRTKRAKKSTKTATAREKQSKTSPRVGKAKKAAATRKRPRVGRARKADQTPPADAKRRADQATPVETDVPFAHGLDAGPAEVASDPRLGKPKKSDTALAETEVTQPRPQAPRGESVRRRRASARKTDKPSTETPPRQEAPAKDEPADEFAKLSPKRAGREMVINVFTEDECRIAVLTDGRLEELFIERASTQSHVGNIYKGRVTNVEPSIQAVFVDFGLTKNGFLHISDVQPQYFPERPGEPEDVGRKIPRHSRPPIQKCFKRGQEVIVQVTKEGVGTKGPTLTTYLSIPGRFLVMMPGMSRHGVSRKIEDEGDRREMREMLRQLKLPTNMGFILRTAGLGQSKRELQRDLNYLLRLWKRVAERIKRSPAPADLYQESNLVTRTIRDVYSSDFARLIVDDVASATRAREFLQISMPRSKTRIELYTEREPLFHRLGIEDEIDRTHMRHVPLASGGSIVIDSTEALVAIDVNSGRFRSLEDAEETAYRINIEAADEIARQLRLRDLGGLIICDFIDMRQDKHKRAVERALRDALKKHKERARILRMSAFGLIEMTRQRQGPSYKRSIFFDCPHCRGSGVVKMPESVMLDVMRFVQLATHHERVQTVKVTAASDVAFQILNNKRATITRIEEETGKRIIIRGDSTFTSDQLEYCCEDVRGTAVQVGRGNSVAAPGGESTVPQQRKRTGGR